MDTQYRQPVMCEGLCSYELFVLFTCLFFLFFKIRLGFFLYIYGCTEVRDLLASALKVLGLKACVAMPSSYELFYLL